MKMASRLTKYVNPERNKTSPIRITNMEIESIFPEKLALIIAYPNTIFKKAKIIG